MVLEQGPNLLHNGQGKLAAVLSYALFLSLSLHVSCSLKSLQALSGISQNLSLEAETLSILVLFALPVRY